MSTVNMIKKLSVKTLTEVKMSAAKVAELGKDGRLVVGDFVGIVIGKGEVPTEYGTSVFFIGDFRAIKATTGEVFGAAKLFMPDLVTLPIAAALDNGQTSVNLALRLIARLDEASPVGFSYTYEHIIDQGDSPVEQMMKARTAFLAEQVAIENKSDTVLQVEEKTEAKKAAK